LDGPLKRAVCFVVPLRLSLLAAEEPVSPGAGPCLPDAVWRADALACADGAVRSSGHAALDAVLPGGGWPVGALVELLQTQPGQGEWRLLAPALAATTGALVLVAPPHAPFVPALAAQGLAPARLLRVGGAGGPDAEPGAGRGTAALDPAARVWAAEQALRCAGVAAVLAWLPQVRPEQLRRLQLAAQRHGTLLFVMRPARARHESSPAVLRLLVDEATAAVPDTASATDPDALVLHLLKRRGPPLEQPLRLSAPPVPADGAAAGQPGCGRPAAPGGGAHTAARRARSSGGARGRHHARPGHPPTAPNGRPPPCSGSPSPARRRLRTAQPGRRLAPPRRPRPTPRSPPTPPRWPGGRWSSPRASSGSKKPC
jgi:protein ImuA